MYPQHIQKVVDEAQRAGGDLSCFSYNEISAAYAGLGHTSGSSFGLKIKSEIDRRNRKKAEQSASYVRALSYLVAFALVVLGVLFTIELTR